MDTPEYDFLYPLIDEYVGDDLTVEDLAMGYSAFLQDQSPDISGHTPMEM